MTNKFVMHGLWKSRDYGTTEGKSRPDFQEDFEDLDSAVLRAHEKYQEGAELVFVEEFNIETGELVKTYNGWRE